MVLDAHDSEPWRSTYNFRELLFLRNGLAIRAVTVKERPGAQKAQLKSCHTNFTRVLITRQGKKSYYKVHDFQRTVEISTSSIRKPGARASRLI
jgi:hypothetical protein